MAQYGQPEPKKPGRRKFLEMLGYGGAAGTMAAGAYGLKVGIETLTDPRKSSGQALIPYSERIDLTDSEVQFRVKLYHAVRDNDADAIEALLKTIPKDAHSTLIAAYPFRTAVEEGRIHVMEKFVEALPELTNAVFQEVIGGSTPLEIAHRHDRQAMFKALHDKGARFELICNPADIVSSKAYRGDLAFLQYLDAKGFRFPEMKGYLSQDPDSPFRRLIDGVMYGMGRQEDYMKTAEFLVKKGYDPLEQSGNWPFTKNALDYTAQEAKKLDKLVKEGGDPTKTFCVFFCALSSNISIEESQKNMAQMSEYFKSLGREAEKAKPKGHIDRLGEKRGAGAGSEIKL